MGIDNYVIIIKVYFLTPNQNTSYILSIVDIGIIYSDGKYPIGRIISYNIDKMQYYKNIKINLKFFLQK